MLPLPLRRRQDVLLSVQIGLVLRAALPEEALEAAQDGLHRGGGGRGAAGGTEATNDGGAGRRRVRQGDLRDLHRARAVAGGAAVRPRVLRRVPGRAPVEEGGTGVPAVP